MLRCEVVVEFFGRRKAAAVQWADGVTGGDTPCPFAGDDGAAVSG